MVNGLKPQMALKCYDNACSIQNILRRLNKVAENIGKENLKRLLPVHHQRYHHYQSSDWPLSC